MKRQFKIQIGAEDWTVKNVRRTPRVDGHNCHGVCDPARNTILIDAKDNEEERLDTLIHEMLHRRLPDWKEEPIALFAEQLADAILAQQKADDD